MKDDEKKVYEERSLKHLFKEVFYEVRKFTRNLFADKHSNLIAHAKRELKLAGLTDKDGPYKGMLADATMELIKVFSKQGHSGSSAALVLQLFNTLGSYKPLTPLTNDPNEWKKIGEGEYQSIRQPDIFSDDNLKTYYSTKNVKERKPLQSKKG